MCLELSICVVSMRGSILDTEPRASMQYLLYARVLLMLVDLGLLTAGIIWLRDNYATCPAEEPKEVVLAAIACNERERERERERQRERERERKSERTRCCSPQRTTEKVCPSRFSYTPASPAPRLVSCVLRTPALRTRPRACSCALVLPRRAHAFVLVARMCTFKMTK